MPSSICQGLQTCLDPRGVEPRVLRLKLTPPMEPGNDVDIPITKSSTRGSDVGSWSSLLSLDSANGKASREATTEKDRVYVHPLAKSSASKLSAESLAMCTESLGSETGSESGDDISLLSLESAENRQPRSFSGGRSNLMTKKQSCGNANFPPPLTSAGGSGGVRVRPHREGGRLVLKAVSLSTSETNFHAERSNGRLRLHLLTAQETEHETEKTEQETGDYDYEDAQEDGTDEIESENEGYWEGDMRRNCGNIGGKIGIEKFERPSSRCKEGGNGSNIGLMNKNWESHFGWPLKPICLS